MNQFIYITTEYKADNSARQDKSYDYYNILFYALTYYVFIFCVEPAGGVDQVRGETGINQNPE